MPRSVVLGNGNFLVCLDKNGFVRDFYFPQVGLENHLAGRGHKIGLFTGKSAYWLDNKAWQVKSFYEKESLVGRIEAVSKKLGFKIETEDAVYNERDVFVRYLKITNLQKKKKEAKLFLHQEFPIYGTEFGGTAFYEPERKAMIHYRGERVFLVTGRMGEGSFDDYTTGLSSLATETSFKDIGKDGVLPKNPVSEGLTDSIIGFDLSLKAGVTKEVFYWVIAGKNLDEVYALNNQFQEKGLGHIIETTKEFWQVWVNKQEFDFGDLPLEVVDLFKRSLLIIRTHIDSKGGIIASGDSDLKYPHQDFYSYVWPRDGCFTAMALDRTGYFDLSRKYYLFLNKVIAKDGYFLVKYLTDGSLGTLKHAWYDRGKPQLPLQEDETGVILHGLWVHYEKSRDIEFIESIYHSLIEKAAEFLVDFRDEKGLPKIGYDLWELDDLGVFTYTAASVYGGLVAAARFAALLKKEEETTRYQQAAMEVKRAIMRDLYDEDKRIFYKGLLQDKKGNLKIDKTIDVSAFWGLIEFGVLDAKDPILEKFAQVIEKKLSSGKPVNGICRFEEDWWYREGPKGPGNPWFLCTLWLTDFYLKKATEKKDLERVRTGLSWVGKYALPSGVLSEQLNPKNGEQVSFSPLTWSHATFVSSVVAYLEKLEELGVVKHKNYFR